MQKKTGGRNKMKKRILSILLTACMVLSLLPGFTITAMAAYSPTIKMTLDGQPISPSSISANFTGLTAYNPDTNKAFDFTEGPVGTYTKSNVTDGTYELSLFNETGDSGIHQLLGNHYLADRSPFTISNTTSYPLTLAFYTVSYKPGTYGKETGYRLNYIAAESRGQNAYPTYLFTRDGYKQIGWSTDANGTAKTYDNSSVLYPTSAMTLYPAWGALRAFTIADGLGVSSTKTSATGSVTGSITSGASAVEGETVTITPGTPAAGYKLSAVKYNDGTEHILTQSGGKYSFTMPAAAVTISSEYVSNTFAVTYNPGTNGTGSQQTATKTGGTALTLKNAIFTREGYEQTGWAITDGGAKAYELGASYTTDAAKDFYPVWTVNSYNISYTLNGGTVSTANPASYTVEGAAITLNTPTRSGYSFLGWTGGNGTTAQTNVSIPTGSTGNKTYTANWKADKPAAAPDASIVTAKTDTSLTITTQDGYEYSVDGTNWYSGTGSYTFTGLTSGKVYNLVCRTAAVNTGNTSAASDASDALSVTTKNAAPAAPSLTFSSITADSVTITAVTGAEYSKDNGATWQDSNTFIGLSAATKYTFSIRIKETAGTVAGTMAGKAQYTAAETPGAGVGYTVNYSTETISITSGYEVSSDSSFASDKLLSNGAAITSGTIYYVRKAVDTTTTPNTPASAFASFTVAARPAKPSSSAYSYDYYDEQIIFASQYEVFTATSGGIAVASDSTAITPGSTIYIRVKSTASAPASSWTTITIPGRPATTGLSLTASRTDTTITVAAIAGAEYSKDGGTTWQSSNVFTRLNPNTDYAINIRYAATASSFTSTPLGSVTIKTKTAPGTAPGVPSVSTQAYNSLTIQAIAGYQYAITTSDTAPTTWGVAETTTGTKTFSSLSAATQYYIWVRVAETDTATPSSSSSISVYTAAATPAQGEGYTIDYSAETISIESGYEVSANNDFGTTLTNGAAITPGTTYYVRKAKDTGTTPYTPASAAVSLTLPLRPSKPAATATGETVAGKNDGRISGMTAAMEWKAADGAYTAVTADQVANGISGRPDGTYYVRYKAVSGTGFKSDEQEITIAAGHTITVTFNSQSGSAVDAITGKAYGDSITAPADPVRSGFYFAGWYKEAACTNPWTFTLDTLTDHITLFAKWSAIPTYTVTGKIVDDNKPLALAVEGATVRMMQGATQFGTTGVTDINGNFVIDNIPPGTYNLVITKGTKTAIIKVEVSSGNVAIGNATLPSGNANSVLVVSGSATPNVVVGGLDSEAGTQLEFSGNPLADNVEVKLTVEKKDASTATKGSEVTDTVTAAGKQVGMILEIDVRKTVNGTEDTSYNQTSGMIEINIPLPADLQGKATYAIYRYHGAAVDTITETPNADLERIVVDRTNWTIALYAKKFSTYAIGYTNPTSPRGGGGGGGGTAAIENQKTVALPYYVKNGKEIFIGFTMDVDGTMKYIAPAGVTVLFRENPKDFSDITGHWAKSNIDFVTERELFLGTGDDKFFPQSGMTRAMFATVIGRLYERSYGELLQKDDNNFTDIDNDSYYAAYIDWASENNIISGIGGGLFKPDREITRQEMAAILYRFAEFLSVLPSGLEKTQLNYPDAAGISSWATEAAGYCQQTGIITGRLGGNFVPQGTATRAEVAAILQRFIESSVK